MSTEEKIEATRLQIGSGTLLITVWIALGVAACWLINIYLGVFFLLFSVFSVLAIIRRQLCSSCYYCKSCTRGFAKLSLLFLGANRIPGIGKGSLYSMEITVYIILTVIPVAVLANSLLVQFTILKILLLAGLLAVTAVSAMGHLRKQ